MARFVQTERFRQNVQPDWSYSRKLFHYAMGQRVLLHYELVTMGLSIQK